MKIIPFASTHYPQIADIYRQGISTGQATFETDAPTWEIWDNNHIPHCRIALLDASDLIKGWAALSPVSGRCVYAGVAEISVYVAHDSRQRGFGTVLLKELILQSEQQGFWTLQAGIFSDNMGSIALHQKCGFRIIGYREKIGKLNGIWKNNVILERRSTIVGID